MFPPGVSDCDSAMSCTFMLPQDGAADSLGVHSLLLLSLQSSSRKEVVCCDARWGRFALAARITFRKYQVNMANHSKATDWCDQELHPGKLQVTHCPNR